MKNPFIPQLQALTEGPNIPLDKPIVLIGRHQECDIQIPSKKVSRRHCCLAQVDDHLAVRDLGSTNGVRINGVKVLEGNLQPGDELMIGNIRYQLRWGEKDSDGTVAPSIKHGIVVKNSQPSKRNRDDDSGDLPVPLPDVSQSQPVYQAKPLAVKENSDSFPNPAPLLIPENHNLFRVDPP